MPKVPVQRIHSENPELDQWMMLAQFSYPLNVSRYLAEHHSSPAPRDTIDYIGGCMRQAFLFWRSLTDVPFDISPIIGYYAATALLSGVTGLLSGTRPVIDGHGMSVLVSKNRRRLGQCKVTTSGQLTGGLAVFAKQFGQATVTGRMGWSLSELFGSIPELLDEYRRCYPSEKPFVLFVEETERDGAAAERVSLSDVHRIGEPHDVLSRVTGLSEEYLPFQQTGEYVVLRPKFGASGLDDYTITGQKVLFLRHHKEGRAVMFSQPVVYLMVLFALSYLARYHPEKWNPFVQSDETGERLLVERFIRIAARGLPNLMLNALHHERMEFGK
ncbi:MAG: YaaC family protein [Dehalococcoidia bacterium]|nr:YaaC family protein [Dehalococcoidia bacterium]